MTISPCSQRPANCCAVKLRWNAAPALSISERESSPLWFPLNTGKSFCQGQRGTGEPTCCTRLKSLSQWVQISIGRQCWNICPPCGQRQALPLNLPHERLQLRTNRLTDKLLWRPNIVPCHSAMGQDHQVAFRLSETVPLAPCWQGNQQKQSPEQSGSSGHDV